MSDDAYITSLVRAARAGSAQSFEALHAMYSRRLFQRLLSITKNHDDAEDALQDTFLRAYLNLDRFQERSKFFSWITRIGINSALMMLRRKYRTAELHFCFQDEEMPFEIGDTRYGPHEILEYCELQQSLNAEIEKLSPALRAAFGFRVNDDSLHDMPHALSLSQSAAKSRLSRARKRLLESAQRERNSPGGNVSVQ